MTKIVFLLPLEIHEDRYNQFIITSYLIYYIIYRAQILKHNEQQKKHTIVLKMKKRNILIYLKEEWPKINMNYLVIIINKKNWKINLN